MNVRKLCTQRGASLVEFAMVAPLLIMLVMGIIDFGWILSQNQAYDTVPGKRPDLPPSMPAL